MIDRLSAIAIVPDRSAELVGEVRVGSRRLRYEVFGPFGRGYNIRVVGPGGTALLEYDWTDHPSADVDAPTGRYEITGEWIKDARKQTVLELRADALTTALTDDALLGLFAVNHHFTKNTGPFVR